MVECTQEKTSSRYGWLSCVPMRHDLALAVYCIQAFDITSLTLVQIPHGLSYGKQKGGGYGQFINPHFQKGLC